LKQGAHYPVEVLEAREVEAMLKACGRGRTGTRTRALIALMWRTGLRVVEAVALERSDLDLKNANASFPSRASPTTSKPPACPTRSAPPPAAADGHLPPPPEPAPPRSQPNRVSRGAASASPRHLSGALIVLPVQLYTGCATVPNCRPHSACSENPSTSSWVEFHRDRRPRGARRVREGE
jgi:hypothetical protein